MSLLRPKVETSDKSWIQRNSIIWALLLCASGHSAIAQRVLQVPSQFPSIQLAMNQADPGDTVNIAPGTYTEALHFTGKAITVQGSAPGVVITAPTGPVVSFDSGESRSAILQNLTIHGGSIATAPSAGGIYISNSSPTIRSVSVLGSGGCGILVLYSAPAISSSVISGSVFKITDLLGCLPAGTNYFPAGGGIVMYGAPSTALQAELTGNTIENNQSVWDSAGLFIFSAGQPLVRDNTVRNNTGNALGAGISIAGDAAPQIIQNLIYDNVLNPILSAPAYADVGTGIQFDLAPSSQRVVVTNNTIVNNRLLLVPGARSQGTQLFATGEIERLQLYNNVIVGSGSQSVIDCLWSNPIVSVQPPRFSHNDIFSDSGYSPYSGACANQTGVNGNLSADPGFSTGPGDVNPYDLSLTSGAVDAGDDEALGLPGTDFLGRSRIQNAKKKATAIVDMGVYELADPTVSAPEGNFTLTLTPGEVSIAPGQTGTVLATLSPLSGFVGTVQLSCVGLPTGSKCAFSPSQLQLTSNTASSNLSVTIGETTAKLGAPSARSWTWAGLGILPLAGLRRRRRLIKASACLITLFLALIAVGCGSLREAYTSTGGTVSILVQAQSQTGPAKQATLNIRTSP